MSASHDVPCPYMENFSLGYSYVWDELQLLTASSGCECSVSNPVPWLHQHLFGFFRMYALFHGRCQIHASGSFDCYCSLHICAPLQKMRFMVFLPLNFFLIHIWIFPLGYVWFLKSIKEKKILSKMICSCLVLPWKTRRKIKYNKSS